MFSLTYFTIAGGDICFNIDKENPPNTTETTFSEGSQSTSPKALTQPWTQG